MTYQCSPTAMNRASSTSRTHNLDVEERLSRVECGQISRKQVNGSSSNHTSRSIGMPVRAPFQDITNVFVSHSLSRGKPAQKILGSVDHPITGTKRSVNPSRISKQSNTPSAGHAPLPTDASERKHYHDRERYLQMTPEQRAAYLERNSEYKRRRKNPIAVSDNAQSGSQTCTCTSGSMHTTIPTGTITEGTGQHKRVAAFPDNGSGHKRRRMSNGAGCSSTGKGIHEDGVANEQEDHDSTIYVPNGCFPAIEDETGQSEYMAEDYDEDDEGYIFPGHGTDCVLSYRDPDHANCEMQEDPFDFIYRNVPSGHHILEPVPNCTHCNAKRFQYENPTFCCMGGKVKIVTPYVHDEMRRLYTSQDPDAKYFQDNIRYFNSHFSFTSLGVILDQRYCNKRSGVYTFRAQGQIYHRIDQLVPLEDGPKHLQLYFYDIESDLQHRFRYSPNLDRVLIGKLASILSSNPYAQTFRSLGSVSNLDEYQIELNTDISLDQRVYNAPTTSQVAAIWVEGNNPQGHFERSIMVYGKSNDPQYIKPWLL